jgi:hypothetical protein
MMQLNFTQTILREENVAQHMALNVSARAHTVTVEPDKSLLCALRFVLARRSRHEVAALWLRAGPVRRGQSAAFS